MRKYIHKDVFLHTILRSVCNVAILIRNKKSFLLGLKQLHDLSHFSIVNLNNYIFVQKKEEV